MQSSRSKRQAQGEKAAGWDPATKTKRRYPWGDEWDTEKGNFGGRHDRTTEVGQYPDDSSAYGLLDVGGNVMEWCSTRWGHNYPYDMDDGREELAGGDDVERVIRGSSWYDYTSIAEFLKAQSAGRCGFRGWYYPREREQPLGISMYPPPRMRCLLSSGVLLFWVLAPAGSEYWRGFGGDFPQHQNPR